MESQLVLKSIGVMASPVGAPTRCAAMKAGRGSRYTNRANALVRSLNVIPNHLGQMREHRLTLRSERGPTGILQLISLDPPSHCNASFSPVVSANLSGSPCPNRLCEAYETSALSGGEGTQRRRDGVRSVPPLCRLETRCGEPGDEFHNATAVFDNRCTTPHLQLFRNHRFSN